MRFFRYAAAVVLVSASLSPAQDALHWARWAPEDAYAVATWQGAKAAAPAFEKSDLGQLWAEPTVHEFVMKPVRSIWPVILESARKTDDGPNRDEISAILQLAQAIWDNPGMVCVFPVTPDAAGRWPYPDSGAAVWDLGESASEIVEKIEAISRRMEKEKNRPPNRHVVIEGIDFEFEHDEENPLYTGVDGRRLIVALGESAARKIAAHLRGGGEGFAGTPAHAQMVRESRGVSGLAYVNLRMAIVRERATKLVREQLLRKRVWMGNLPKEAPLLVAGALGLMVFQGNMGGDETAIAIGFEGRDLRTVWFAKSDPAFAWPPDFISHQPIDPKFLNLIPGSALSAGITTLDAAKAYQAALTAAERLIASTVPATQPAPATSPEEAEALEEAQEAGDDEEVVDMGEDHEEPIALSDPASASQPADSAPGWIARRINGFTEPHGLNIERDILAHIGRHLAYYQDREFAGASLNVLVELADQPAFEKQLDKWLSLLPEGVTFKPRAVGGRRLFVLDVSKLGVTLPPMALSPCYAIAENCLLVSTNVAAGTRWLRSLDNQGTPRLSGRAELATFLERHKGDRITRLSLSDEAGSFQILFAQLAMFYPIVSQTLASEITRELMKKSDESDSDEEEESDDAGESAETEGDMEAAASLPESAPASEPDADAEEASPASQPTIEFAPLPDYEAFARHMRTTVSYVRQIEGGRVYQGHSGVGFFDGSGLVIGASVGAAILLPSLARAREFSKRAACASRLKEIGTALYTYAAEHDDRFPGSIQELIELNAITPQTLRCPSAEHPTRSYIYIPGQGTEVHSNNVIMYERDNHDGEGANVLFADARVEFVKPYHYVKQLVRETKERLHGATSQPE